MLVDIAASPMSGREACSEERNRTLAAHTAGYSSEVLEALQQIEAVQ